MPITFAHPAAVLPLVHRFGKGGWIACLVMGSMAPDLVQTWWPTRLPHSVEGLFVLDAPVALLLGWMVHGILRNRLPALPGWNGPIPGTFHLGWALLGSFLGCVTHLAWDLVTHADSVPVVRFLLHHQASLDRIGFAESGPVRFLQMLWYLNSLAGVVLIALYLSTRIRRTRGLMAQLPWKPLAIAGAAPFLPLLVEVPLRLALEEGRPLQRLSELSMALRMDCILAPLLVLAVFLVLTDRNRRFAASSERSP